MKVLCYTSPARGHLYPVIPILQELASRGHDITVRTLADGVEQARGAGLHADAVDPRIEAVEIDDYLGRTPVDGLKRSTATFAQRAPYEVEDIRRAIADVRPDVLLVDCNCWGASAAAEGAGLPWASWVPYPVPVPRAGVPPFGPGLRPATGRLGRMRDRVLEPVVLGSVLRSVRPALNKVRAAAGVRPIRTVTDMYARAPLTLYLTAEPFEYAGGDWPESFRLVGPVGWDPPADVPQGLAEVDRPIVLVTTSSERQDDDGLVRAALEGLRGADVHVVATLPSGVPDDLDVPANATVARFVPHSAVLPKAACVVTHGGMGATQKALAAGVPVVAAPFGRDQFEVARRVELSDAGQRLPGRKVTPERLAAAVERAMTQRAGAAALAEAFARAGGAVRAADEVEELSRTAAAAT